MTVPAVLKDGGIPDILDARVEEQQHYIPHVEVYKDGEKSNLPYVKVDVKAGYAEVYKTDKDDMIVVFNDEPVIRKMKGDFELRWKEDE